MAQTYSEKLIGMVEDGLLDWEMVARECIQRMSEDEVEAMIQECDWDDDSPYAEFKRICIGRLA